MINILKLNIKAIKKNRTFTNYILLNLIIILFLMISIIIYFFCVANINSIINDESNREFFIYDYIDIRDIDKDIIDNIYYDVLILDENINKHNYTVESNSEIDEKYTIYINQSNLKDFEIYEEYLDIKFNEDLDKNTFVVNQTIAKYLYENHFDNENTFTLVVKLKYYQDIEKFCQYLDKDEINYNINSENNSDISVFEDAKFIIKILIFIISILCIIILIVLYSSILVENKKNIKIFSISGLSSKKVALVYYLSYMFFISLIFIPTIIIIAIVLLFLNLKYNSNLLEYFNYMTIIPYIVYIIITFITFGISMVILNKKYLKRYLS